MAGLPCRRCECGECECEAGWAGPACDCPTEKESCRSPYDGQICSGHGECSCGECQCSNVAGTNNIYRNTPTPGSF